jgi:hypothetical protein
MKIEKFNERKIFREVKPIADFLYDKFFDRYKINGVQEKESPKFLRVQIKFLKGGREGTWNKYTPVDFAIFTNFYEYMEKYGTIEHFSLTGYGIEVVVIISLDNVEKLKQTPEYQEWYERVIPEVNQYLADRALKKSAKKYNL